MGSVRIPQAQLSEIQQPKGRKDQSELIMQVLGNNPLAQGIESAGTDIVDALAKRAEMRRQTEQQARAFDQQKELLGIKTGAESEAARIKREQDAARYDREMAFKELQQADLNSYRAASLKSKERADKADTEIKNIDEQLGAIDKLEGLLINSWAGPVAGRAARSLSMITGGSIQQPSAEYNALRPAYAVKVYRALTGDTRLSDADAAGRALPLMPTENDQPIVQKAKWDNLRELIKTRRMQYSGESAINDLVKEGLVNPD